MKIGLIVPNKDGKHKTVSLGLAYAAAYAKEQHKGLDFHVLDTRVATPDETREFFGKSFDLIGITILSPAYNEVINIFNKIKQTDTKVPVCLGGSYVSTIKENIFNETPADFAIYGESEITFSELLFHLEGKRKLTDISGLMYRNSDGNIIINPPRPKIKDLNALPLPAYEIFRMDRYTVHRMVTSRGCIYACTWCNSAPLWDHSYRTTDPEKIIAEIELLIKNYGNKTFIFGDYCFNADLKRVGAICDLLILKKIKILWSAALRADLMTPEIALKMKKAGCHYVSVGIESANNEILKNIGKGTTIEKISEGISLLKEAEIEIMAHFVIGSPGETLNTVKESLAYAKNSGCDFTDFRFVLPYKGTRQWDYVSEHGTFFTRDIHHFHSMQPEIVFETPEFPHKDRLTVVKLLKEEGFYSKSGKKNPAPVFGNDAAKKQPSPQQTFLEKFSHILKSIFRS